ncbi:conjugal transfer protein TraP [Pseudomonas sp. MAG002Y]|nr:conjugal transfer protein TraP [Pseudomonas sp. MAG002Y]
MSEFSPAVETTASSIQKPPPRQASGLSFWQRPIALGLSLPWLMGVVLILAGAAWYLFAPEETPTVNRLAFQDDFEQQHLHVQGASVAPAVSAPPESDLGQFKNEVAAMIGGVRTYGEVNRAAIERLSTTLKALSAAQQVLQQQLNESQAQNSVLSARVSFLEGRPGAMTTSQQVSRPVAKTRSPLAGMQVQAVQNGMAWVYWQDKTWAVKAGDQLGKVTVTRIDAKTREVETSAGTLR